MIRAYNEIEIYDLPLDLIQVITNGNTKNKKTIKYLLNYIRHNFYNYDHIRKYYHIKGEDLEQLKDFVDSKIIEKLKAWHTIARDNGYKDLTDIVGAEFLFN